MSVVILNQRDPTDSPCRYDPADAVLVLEDFHEQSALVIQHEHGAGSGIGAVVGRRQ